ncbi:TIGR03564 family F420-dependent LLM class oxidoreductase [Nocardia arthritidis]|uniref:TIGR03564 family F420-dependent LLM class oxidoreductase n=1 Tax=Nocardia arthritidis TaxID=228602 RepID=A0A6G9YD53_9NOCA|nr:TIGR03564 family F420-dependent LLM class oxidoreductase [Nocardia arthritidis]QIS11060.1 TIGR03564 family F420-dependent LLM class oxidoreductase [Nocardia arthritidis]
MTIGIALSPFTLNNSDNAVDAAVAFGREAVAAGLSSVWFGQLFGQDSIAVAGTVGRELPELEVGTSVVPIGGRHPLVVAGQAQTAQATAHGRFTLGVGTGGRAAAESAFGITFDRPIAYLREFLTALQQLLETGTADLHGEILTAAPPFPADVAGARPRVPVLVAAMGPQALRVAGELADGTLPYLIGPQVLAKHIVEPINAAAERAGRPRPRIAVMVTAVVTSDVEAARAQAEQSMAFYDEVPSYRRVIELSGVRRAAELAVIGDEETVAARIAEFFDAGATDVIVASTDLNGDADRLRTWRLLGELNSKPRA